MSLIIDSSSSPTVSVAAPSDYFALLKPRVMSLVIFTALAGMLLAPGHVNVVVGFAALLAIAVGAGASGALNMWYDADIDAAMGRTSRRPIPSGRVQPHEALVFGLTLAFLAVFTLGVVTNWFAAGLLAFTIFFYVVVYSMWLKRTTPQNIVIGGAAGAFPPVVAHVAATGSVSLSSLVLFAIIFLWTPPHFWALALLKAEDYARVGVPMLPNAKGPDRTRLEILLYSLVLVPVAILPWVLGFASLVYGLVALALGICFIVCAGRVFRRRTGAAADKAAWRLFFFSIFYLFALFAVIVAEQTGAIVMGHFA